jgi:hypothetical protein
MYSIYLPIPISLCKMQKKAVSPRTTTRKRERYLDENKMGGLVRGCMICYHFRTKEKTKRIAQRRSKTSKPCRCREIKINTKKAICTYIGSNQYAKMEISVQNESGMQMSINSTQFNSMQSNNMYVEIGLTLGGLGGMLRIGAADYRCDKTRQRKSCPFRERIPAV